MTRKPYTANPSSVGRRSEEGLLLEIPVEAAAAAEVLQQLRAGLEGADAVEAVVEGIQVGRPVGRAAPGAPEGAGLGVGVGVGESGVRGRAESEVGDGERVPSSRCGRWNERTSEVGWQHRDGVAVRVRRGSDES